SAASIRIACAAAVARGTRPWDPSKKRTGGGALVRYAQAALFAGAALGLGYWYLKVRLPPAPVTKRAIAPPAAPAKAPSSAPAPPPPGPRPPIPRRPCRRLDPRITLQAARYCVPRPLQPISPRLGRLPVRP